VLALYNVVLGDCLKIYHVTLCICRPEQFSDMVTAAGKTQDSIPDDMLPPSDAESDESAEDDVHTICNPNRQRLRDVDNTEDNEDSGDSETEQK